MRIDPNENTIICGDNLKWLNDIPDESVDLCYIDPPFFSNRNYEIVWGNGFEVASFGDRFQGGINHYIEWMRPRIALIHKKLKNTGSIFLHCDHHASHRLRVLLDELFGQEKFNNEIIWCYGSGGVSKKRFARKHDTIFWYSKSNKYKFNVDDIRQPYKEKCKVEYKVVNGKSYQRKNPLGRVPFDWFEIPILTNTANERIGYATQKPEELVSMLVRACSDDGDVVLDCFAGGFTTAKVCADLKRKFICGDVSPVACKIGAKRLNQAGYENGTDYYVKGLYQSESEYREMSGHDFAETICDLMGWTCNEKKSNDKGIDGWDGNGNPVQIKNQSSRTGERDLRNFMGSLTAAKKKHGIFVAWDFVEGPNGAYAFVAKHKNEVTIELRKCKDLIGDLLIPEDKKQQIEELFTERCPSDWIEHQVGA